jgi:HD-GYP domain-containing protein (c-di-GMP phosphodiesterase class II)
MELDGEQLKLMRRHPLLGARIMESMGFLDQEVPAVRHHHERYDGTGYPDGLAGAAIPLLARIVAVADSFDAITSPRTFRSAKSIDQAVAELQANAGTQFDPGVVEATIAVAERMGEKLIEFDAPPTAGILADLAMEPA